MKLALDIRKSEMLGQNLSPPGVDGLLAYGVKVRFYIPPSVSHLMSPLAKQVTEEVVPAATAFAIDSPQTSLHCMTDVV